MNPALDLNEALERNQAQTARLARLTSLGDDQLRGVVHHDWTVSGKLAHLAFWDRFVLATLERWATGKPIRIETPQWYDDIQNESVLAGSLALQPRTALQLALDAASALDARLAGLGADESARLEADAANPDTDANWLVHRYHHRREHLNEIERTLAALAK